MDRNYKRYILSTVSGFDDAFSGLYFELDMANGGFGNVQCENFEWDRAKSNANVREKGFSFYYARLVFMDQGLTYLRGGDIVPGESRRLVAGYPLEDYTHPLLVVVEVELDADGYFHRIISAWENESPDVEEKYERRRDWRRRANSALKNSLLRGHEHDKDWLDNVPPGVRAFLNREV
jgi:uncharacterized DUF497 family protein